MVLMWMCVVLFGRYGMGILLKLMIDMVDGFVFVVIVLLMVLVWIFVRVFLW